MLKRITTSLLIVIVLAFIILGGLWLISRHQAEKVGQKPLTFREFFTVGYRNGISAPGVSNELSSEFTPGNNSSAPEKQTGGSVTSGENAEVSQFTGGTLTPAGNDFGGQQDFRNSDSFTGTNIGGGSDLGGGSDIGNSPTTTGNGGSSNSGKNTDKPTSSSTAINNLTCTEADTNITFSQDELDKLAALQSRFDAVAQVLHTDANVQEELSNYEALVLKEKKDIELTNYCQAKVPLLADPVLKRKVPTPFWHTNNDSDSYLAGTTPSTIDVTNSTSGKAALERVFRINFW